jgi:D-alanine transaminase
MSDFPQLMYLNGEKVEPSEAKVSVFDYGFLFGAGVYDVALVMDGHLFQGKEHMDRFFKSAATIGIPIKETKEEILKIVRELVEHNNLREGIVYFQATYGAYGKRSHKFPADLSSPTLVIFTQYLAPYPTTFFTEGVKLVTEPEFRWTRCDIKAVGLLPAILSINKLPTDAAESVFYDSETKMIRECAASNIFCVKGDTIYTPPLSKYILPGIERQTIINIARANHLKLKEEDFDLDFFLSADEVFMSSSTKEVLPIKQVDNTVFENTPGEKTRQLMKLFVEYVENELGPNFVHPKRKLELF